MLRISALGFDSKGSFRELALAKDSDLPFFLGSCNLWPYDVAAAAAAA